MNTGARAILTSALLVLCCVSALAAEAKRVPRPMVIHRVAELGLEIWTESDPEWETRLERQNGQLVFAAETPALTYPPAGMTWISMKGVRFSPQDMKEGARGAIHGAARNYGVQDLDSLQLKAVRYGDLNGYESRFSAVAQGTPVDVLIFLGHQPGKPAVLAHAYAQRGKLDHISENIRRSWTNLRYLK